MKAQLYAKNTFGEIVLLQLSEDFPINMTLSIQDQNPFEATSYYSQTFRIPGQGKNGQFFEDVYSVNGSTFNAGVAAESWILTNGFLFSVGNLTLVAVHTNEVMGTIEYEVFFLGDTSDFATAVGDLYMNQINTSELDHVLNYSAITSSWGATAGATSGFKDGNVLYPLCEWGYTYDSNNFPTLNTVSVGYPKGASGYYGGSFTKGPTGGLELTQFKPAVRVKWLWDKIFSDAGFSYQSEFLNSDLFDRMYMVSDSVARPTQDIQAGLCQVVANSFQQWFGQTERIRFTQVVTNSDGAFDTATSSWTSPADGTFSFTISGYCIIFRGFGYPQAAFKVYVYKNGTVINTPTIYTTALDINAPFVYVSFNVTETLLKDDNIWVELQQMPYSNSDAVFQSWTFKCGSAPDFVVVSSFLPGEGSLKKLDFIKGITTMFNLVWEPSRDVEKRFIIEPWVDWVSSGTKKDWTALLDASRDITLEPAFLEQPRILNFGGQDDADLQNDIFQKQYKKNWLYREFNSNIKVIKDEGQVSIPFGGTPLQSIPSKTTQYPDWVVPTFAKLQPGDPAQEQAGKVQPIQPEPRILFYNGVKATPVSWYLMNDAQGLTGTAQNTYPLVSEFSTFPPDSLTTQLVLNFQTKPALWSQNSTFIDQPVNDLYTVYWQDYVEWIYNPYNRKMKASFRLDPKEVHNFKFNDKIWVKDSWFFVQKINDYPVGDKAIVEVEMIKVPDSITPPSVVPATGPVSGSCVSVSYCNNERDLDAAPVAFQYVDCDFNLRSETLYPSTCLSVCAIFPNPYGLPNKFTEIPNGNCPGGVYATAGAFIDLDLQGNNFIAEDKITTAILSGATGGPTGTFIPLQYFSVLGEDSINVEYNVPFGYGAKFDLIFANGASGAAIFDMEISLATNGVTGATAYRMITYQPLSATYPAGITGANYTALCRIDY